MASNCSSSYAVAEIEYRTGSADDEVAESENRLCGGAVEIESPRAIFDARVEEGNRPVSAVGGAGSQPTEIEDAELMELAWVVNVKVSDFRVYGEVEERENRDGEVGYGAGASRLGVAEEVKRPFCVKTVVESRLGAEVVAHLYLLLVSWRMSTTGRP